MGFLDWCSNAASNIGSGLAAAGSAIADGATALVDGRAVNGVVDAAKWVNEKAIQPAASWVGENAPKLLEADTWKAAGQGIADYASFVKNNPGLALRQAGQGLSNSVTGLVGFAGDVVIYAGEGIAKGAYNLAAGAVNLGANDGERIIEYAGMSKFSKLQDLAEEYTGGWLGYTRAELDQMVQDGKISEQDARFAAGTKYGFQAVGEVATFVAISAVTAGAGGALMAGVRGGAVGLRVAEAGNVIARTGRLGEVVAKPLLWFGSDASAVRGLQYLERASALVKTEQQLSTAGRILHAPLDLARAYRPGQTSQVFARWAAGSSNSTFGYGMRAAEGTFRFFNPIQANGRSFIAWGLEGGGATLSYVSNSAKEGAELEMMRTLKAAEDSEGDSSLDEMRRQLGLPVEGEDNSGQGETSPERTAPEGTEPEQITPNIREGFQDNADRDSALTHTFTINNGLVQPTELDPAGGRRDSTGQQYAPGTPGVGNANR